MNQISQSSDNVKRKAEFNQRCLETAEKAHAGALIYIKHWLVYRKVKPHQRTRFNAQASVHITCRWSSMTPAQDEEVRAFEWSRPLTGYTLYTVRANRPNMHFPLAYMERKGLRGHTENFTV